jgi:hypothetical protein
MGVWETLSGELAVSTGREFERRALQVFRLWDTAFVQPPEMQSLDRQGVDLLIWSDSKPFPWVVQCKGFKELDDLGDSQVRQALASIDAFKISGLKCQRYTLVHNRTGKNQTANALIKQKLDELIAGQSAKTAELWDRQQFLKHAKQQLKTLIATRLKQDAKQLLRENERIFKFGSVYIERVPTNEYRAEFGAGQYKNLVKATDGSRTQAVAKIVANPRSSRWTMLIGEFGTGKTTTSLHAARLATRNLIYVRADLIAEGGGGVGTNYLLSRAIEGMQLFADLPDETRALAERLGGGTLSTLLKGQKDTPYVLLIDGLDENRAYSRWDGLRRLTNELAELRCSIVLTTRQEHFYSAFSNFEAAFGEISRKGGSRDGVILQLLPWGETEIDEYLSEVSSIASPEEVNRISTASIDRYLLREFGTSPLFLQMIVEEIAAGDAVSKGRAELVDGWIRRKIVRDLQVPRDLGSDVVDLSSFVETMMVLQTNIAKQMIHNDGTQWELVEQIESRAVEREAKDLFGGRSVDVASIVLCSLLTPVSARSKGALRVKFALRVCHEFFLARYLAERHEATDDYPKAVQTFAAEMQY